MSKSSKSELQFETSRELKRFFSEEFELWRKRTRYSLDDLANNCGVSPSYLSHVGRYGRVPSKPVLILLALNLGLREPQRLFDAAGLREQWPLDPTLRLGTQSDSDPNFLSLKLDMRGFTDTIREIVRSETKPRSYQQLLSRGPLRIGVNMRTSWFGGQATKSAHHPHPHSEGFFSEFCEKLTMTLQAKVDLVEVEFGTYIEKLHREEIDLFGPVLEAPNRSGGLLFTAPLYRVGMSALWRKSKCSSLPACPPPKSVADLSNPNLRIAVIKGSRAHILANTRYRRPDTDLVICSTPEEALERVLFKGIKNGAHIFIVNTVEAKLWQEEHPDALQLLFHKPDTLLDMSNACLAVRHDWPELVPPINDFISFLNRSGALTDMFQRWAPPKMGGVLEPVSA